ncbi:TDRD1-like protein [Mya arenaria]|uniref:RNA helicase n=1 Tax=Mya arenaria TaxID=6604 RepID=A0ABY7ENY0_MYAAR|nr:TDRD1-like protein [Mya arenaria]
MKKSDFAILRASCWDISTDVRSRFFENFLAIVPTSVLYLKNREKPQLHLTNKVDSHGQILAKVVKEAEQDGDGVFKDYEEMLLQLNSLLDNRQMASSLPYHPTENELCAGKVESIWFRVEVKNVLSRKSGPHGTCYRVDEGDTLTIPVAHCEGSSLQKDVEVPIVKTKEDLIRERFRKQREDRRLREDLSSRSDHEFACHPGRPTGRFSPVDRGYRTDGQYNDLVARKTSPISTDEMLANEKRQKERVVYVQEERLREVPSGFAIKHESKGDPQGPIGVKLGSHVQHVSEGSYDKEAMRLMSRPRAMMQRLEREQSDLDDHNMNSKGYDAGKVEGPSRSFSGDYSTTEEAMTSRKSVEGASLHAGLFRGRGSVGSLSDTSGEGGVQRLGRGLMSPQFRGLPDSGAQSDIEGLLRGRGAKSPLTSVSDDGNNSTRSRKSLSPLTKVMNSQLTVGSGLSSLLTSGIGRANSPGRGRSSGRESDGANSSALSADEGGYRLPLHGRGVDPKLPQSPKGVLLYRSQNLQSLTNYDSQSENEKFENALDAEGKSDTHIAISLPKSKQIPSDVFNQSDSDDSDRQLNISQTSSILSEPQNPGQVAMSTRVKFRGVETSPVSRGNRPLATQHSGQGDCSETINSDVEQRKVAVSQQLPNTLNSRLPLTIPPETISADAGLKEKTKLVDLKKLLPPQLNKSKATDVKSESVLKDANLKHGSPVTTNVEGNNSAAPVSRKQAREEAKGKTARDFVDISPPFANKVDRRILERLTQGAGVSKKQAMQGDGAESVKFQSTDRVLVHGGSLRHPWFSIQDTRFAPTITKSFEDQDFRSPQLVQSYSWPIIVRGRHLVALSPPSTGKTLAYLFPLLSALTVTSHYDEIRKNGSGVVDDADVVLEKFIPEMNYIIKEYDLLINNEMKHYECPRQILVFGSMWNQGVDKFMATMNEPMLVITSHLEASIYGGVRQTLRQYSIYCMMVHSDMDLYQALDVAKETELPLLEESWRQAKPVHDLLVRSGTKQTPELQKFMGGIEQRHEEDESRDLCDQQLAFGVCRDVWRCRYRHSVMPDVDVHPSTDWLPNEGEIKASVFVHTELHGREMEGKIVLRLGHRLWLDPLVMRLKLGETRTIINKFSVHTELIRNGLADENPSIGAYVERQEEDDVLQEPQVGKYCLAQYASFDERWYRGHIQTVKDDTVEIFFPDYGDLDFVPRDKVREFPVDKFFELPLQAIECKLANIEKIGDTWEIRAGDALWDMSHFVNEKDLRPLVATVVQAKEETKYAGRQKFVVELRTTQRDLGQELVWRQLAKHTPDCTKYTPLLPRSTPGKRVFPSRLHKIPGLCSAVYWEKNSCSIYQRQAADFITQAANISVRLQEAFRGQDSTDVLFELMESTMCQQVQGAVCQAFASLTSGSDGGHDDFKKESLMEAIVKNLQKTDCPKCIAFCVQQCDHFASTRRKHKTFLIEHHMITILNRILDLEMPPATKQLCKDLKTSLDFKVPSEPIRGLLLKPGMQHMGPMSDSLVAPEVRWNQNSFVMLLVIKVCDVNPAAHDLVTFTEDTISFRALSRGVNYGFTYRLYDRVCVEKCTWHVKQREVLVSLKKQEKGMWSRPLHDKIKHGNVVADCEHILDSSDSEEKDDQRPFLLSKGKKKKAMFRGMKQSTVQVREPEDTETDTSDSLENMDDFDNRTDYDFNSIAYQNPI